MATPPLPLISCNICDRPGPQHTVEYRLRTADVEPEHEIRYLLAHSGQCLIEALVHANAVAAKGPHGLLVDVYPATRRDVEAITGLMAGAA